MRRPRRLVVADVPAAAAWYAQVFDGVVTHAAAEAARVALGAEGVALELTRGPPPPPSTTPVLEFMVDALDGWLADALAAGATRSTPATLDGYAQLRDPFGYLWALRRR